MVDIFRAAVEQLAASPMSRRRMTYVYCSFFKSHLLIAYVSYVASQQTLALSFDKEGHALLLLDGSSLRAVAKLADDDIEGVRIGVARFAALIYRKFFKIFFVFLYSSSDNEDLLFQAICSAMLIRFPTIFWNCSGDFRLILPRK